ncbi:unnamed protein product [Caenorhabditis nigoni]
MKHTLYTTLFLLYSTALIPTVIPCEVTFVIETGRNFNSSDIEKVLEKSVDSLSQCTRYCSSIQNCSHFTFSHAAEKNIISNCHLFRSTTSSSNSPHSIEKTSGSLTVGTKTCLESKCPKRSFAFEKFSEKSLLNSSFIIKTFSVSVDECLSKCQKDSSCRAALHNHDTSLCQLSRVSLNSVYNPRLYFKSSHSTDLYENNCIDYTMTSSGCTFMRVKGGGLKSVSDQLIQNVRSTEECEQMCVILHLRQLHNGMSSDVVIGSNVGKISTGSSEAESIPWGSGRLC